MKFNQNRKADIFPDKVILSNQTYLSIVSEVSLFSDIETGGIFLGTIENNNWYIIESIDPGYENSVRHHAYFEYDVKYVNHLANVRRALYEKEPVLLGLWHRHPGSMDTFSGLDMETNRGFAEKQPPGALSALINIDPAFRITMYHFTPAMHCTKCKNICIGDESIPPEYLRLKKHSFFLDKINKPQRKTDAKTAKRQDKLIAIFGDEYSNYLGKQHDYECEFEMEGNSIKLKMKRTGPVAELPPLISARFFFDETDPDRAAVQFDGTDKVYDYEENIIQKFVAAKQKQSACKKTYNNITQYGEMTTDRKNAKHQQ